MFSDTITLLKSVQIHGILSGTGMGCVLHKRYLDVVHAWKAHSGIAAVLIIRTWETMDMSASEKMKRKLVKALVSVMEREPLDRITVTEIVDACEVTRPTFYRYFKDKYDLVNWHFENLAQKSFRQMGVSLSLREGFTRKFQLMLEERVFFTSAFSSQAQNCLIDYDYECIYHFYRDVIRKKGEHFLTPDIDFLLRMYCHGSIYMTAEWAKKNMPLSPETIVENLLDALPPKLYELLKHL